MSPGSLAHELIGVPRGTLLTPAILAALIAGTVALMYPPVWSVGDDTAILREAGDLGLAALASPYHGYLQLIQRAASLLQGPDPLLVGALGSYLAVAFVAWFLARRVHPIALLALILAPALSVYGTLSNIQWVLAVYLVAMLVASPPTSTRGRLGDAIGIFLCGLTGPFSIVLLPLYALRAINPIWRWHLVALATAAVIQAAFVILTPRPVAPDHDLLAVMLVRDAVPVVVVMVAGWWFTMARTLGALYVALVIPVLGLANTVHPTSDLLAGDGQRYFYLPWAVGIAMALLVLLRMIRGPDWRLDRLLRARPS